MNTSNPTTGTVFLTIREASRVTGLSMYHLRQLKRRGELPHVLSGNRVMVDIPRLIAQLREPKGGCD